MTPPRHSRLVARHLWGRTSAGRWRRKPGRKALVPYIRIQARIDDAALRAEAQRILKEILG